MFNYWAIGGCVDDLDCLRLSGRLIAIESPN